MAKPSPSNILFCLAIFSFVWISEAQKLVPALYVFGDSTVDPGNNNKLNNYAKSNYPPYGVDFPSGVTGRPTNGYNFADFFAKWLGLKLTPAIRLVDTSNFNAINEGINFASSSAGVLPETAINIFQGILSLEAQVDLFRKTVQETLPSHYNTPNALYAHLSKSIFLVVMGTNDYGFTFLGRVNSSNPMNYVGSAVELLTKLGDRLTDLYKLGARKFVVFEIGALGCQPSYVTKFKPKSKCVDFINVVIEEFNKLLPARLVELGFRLPGSRFTVARLFHYTLSLVHNPAAFGFKDAVNPCCPIVVYGPCEPNKAACSDRDSHVYFDAFHMTQASYRLLSQNCFSGVGSCVPFNIRQLAML